MNHLHETKSASHKSLQGHFLVAAPHIHQPPYRHAVILVIQHHEEGAIGLVLDNGIREHLAGAGKAEVANRIGRAVANPSVEMPENANVPDPRLFSGIVIWPAGQLDRDVTNGIWMLSPACFEMDFSGDDLWVDQVRQIGRMVLRESLGICDFPMNPSLN